MGPKSKRSPKRLELEGKYANYFKIGHNAYEFVLDFGQFYPGTEEAELYSRIVINPAYVKELSIMLDKSIDQYETTFGRLDTIDDQYD